MLVVTGRAVSGRAELDVATDTPTHLKRLVHLLDHTDLLDLPVAVLALDARGDVPHVRKLDVVGHLVYPVPGYRLGTRRVAAENLDLLRILGAVHKRVAAHAGRYGGDPGAHRAFCREVAVLTIDLIIARVHIVRKRDRLPGGAHRGGGRGRFILSAEGGNGARE